MLKTQKKMSESEPGRSIKLRSVTSEPLIRRTMQLEENGTSDSVWSVSAPERKASDDTD